MSTRTHIHLRYPAMKETLRLDSRLHRDISVGNIILVKEPGSDRDVRRGYLVDWESSTCTDENGRAIESGRAVSTTEVVCYPN